MDRHCGSHPDSLIKAKESEEEEMNVKELQKIDIRYLNEKAQRIFEASDTGALVDLFEGCETIEEINETAGAVWDDLFGQDEG